MMKPQMKIVVSEEVQKVLHKTGERYGMTGNAIVAAAAYELSRIRPEELWHALGRIAGENAPPYLPPGAAALPAPQNRQKRALPA